MCIYFIWYSIGLNLYDHNSLSNISFLLHPLATLNNQNKVQNVRQLHNSSNENTIIYRADLIPCHNETGEPLDAWTIAHSQSTQNDNNGGDDKLSFSGNDALYIPSSTNVATPNFQIQIVVSRASEGVYTNKLRQGLYSKGRKAVEDGAAASEECIGGVSIQELIHSDEELKGWHDKLGSSNNNTNTPQGFYMQVMLLEPNVKENDLVIGPPPELNKVNPTFRPLFDASSSQQCSQGSSFYQSVYTSPQFTSEAGPWEQENIKAFELVALDVEKALVRVEFPEFNEGCKDKTFREVYQLNARVITMCLYRFATAFFAIN